MKNDFERRHLGPHKNDLPEMLNVIGVESLDALIEQTIPASIRLDRPLSLPSPMTEHDFLAHLRRIAAQNVLCKSYLGQGYYHCITPTVIQRSIFENPGWYTQYTPYQAEISQGRLEALLNFQTMVTDLTGLEVANASLLDEGTAAAEAMAMAHGITNRSTNGSPRNRLFVSERCYVQTVEVLKSRALPLGIEVVSGDHRTVKLDSSYFGIILQYPDEYGAVSDFSAVIRQAHDVGALAIIAADLLSLALLVPPGEFGADIAVGSTQRLGVPMGYGGPHAAYFATRMEFIRSMPGRIIGVSIDAQNNPAYRMTLQTREQHIRREKATSNICTAQALLAIMAGMYAVYHGPDGIRSIASRINHLARVLEAELSSLGFGQMNNVYFDTLNIETGARELRDSIVQIARQEKMNFRSIGETRIGISIDETVSEEEILMIVRAFARAKEITFAETDLARRYESQEIRFPTEFHRTSRYLQHAVFNTHHSETQLLRYIKMLENRDLSLTGSMIPLGSCTMKLNAATELMPVSWPEFSQPHPFVPVDQVRGYKQIIDELEHELCEITGFAAASLQPNSGAQGEFAGLSVIRAYHADRGESHRNVALIPSSAHGTNPASAVMAGLSVVVVNCDANGNIDVSDLKKKAEQHQDVLAALMVTYPSTHGVFEEEIREVCTIVHSCGGQVYMDGANMNAQVGLTSPALIGADVIHLNLHKTFAIPHGGGGPGMGPICVAKHLAPFLPGHPVVKTGGEKGIPAVASTPYGSTSIILISYAYIRLLGSEGLTNASRYAILTANYLKSRLERYCPILYKGKNDRVAHEFILNTKQFKQTADVDVEDIAKRLMDYSFHAPTVSFPVPGTLMVEPTESEPREELDRFVDAMVSIREEIRAIEEGRADKFNNVLKNAPHTGAHATKDQWDHPYTREQAVFPLPSLKIRKFWPPVGRINSTYGDRNIFCTCPPLESFIEGST